MHACRKDTIVSRRIVCSRLKRPVPIPQQNKRNTDISGMGIRCNQIHRAVAIEVPRGNGNWNVG